MDDGYKVDMSGFLAEVAYQEITEPGYSCEGCGTYRDGTLNPCEECGEPSAYLFCDDCGAELVRVGNAVLFPCEKCGYDPDGEGDDDERV